MNFWCQKNGLNLAPLSSCGPYLEFEDKIVMDHPSAFDVLSESDAFPYDFVDAGLLSVDASPSNSLEDTLRSSSILEFIFVSPPCLVLSYNSDPSGHLNCCFFEPNEHLLVCPTDPIGMWDSVDQLLHGLDSSICPKRVFIDLLSLEHSDHAELPSSSNQLSRSKKNLILA
jgi:hypothetical protein